MNDDERKPRLHIHMGGLIILIIILLILFKVDIKSKIKSPQFQKNITYIENSFKDLWGKYVKAPLEKNAKSMIKDATNKGIDEIKDSINNKLQ